MFLVVLYVNQTHRDSAVLNVVCLSLVVDSGHWRIYVCVHVCLRACVHLCMVCVFF